MRALFLALVMVGATAAAGCASGVSCTDKSGICNAGVQCPNGYEVVSGAQLTAAGSGSYSCPANSAIDGGTNAPICCLPIPASN